MNASMRMGKGHGLALALALFAGLAAIRAAALQFEHSLHSIDGALQTWFALENFAAGAQLGREFQSYLGITMVLALLPAFLAFGQTLYASTLSAHLFVLLGAFASAYGAAWFIRFIPASQRWIAAIGLLFVFYYALPFAGELIDHPFPLAFDPGHSLRPIRGFLPFFMLPVVVVCLRAILRRESLQHGFALGLAGGIGLLWSNDAGIPLVIALVLALALALFARPFALLRILGVFAGGVLLGAGAVLVMVTHGEPGFWLRYNFVDVAGDQVWYFGPWDRSARIFGPLDLVHIVQNGRPIAVLTLLSLIACAALAALRLVLRRGARVRGAAFVFVASSLIGTALLPQVGGHVGSGYNDITVFFGALAPLIVGQRMVLRLARPLVRWLGGMPLRALAWGAVLAMIGLETATLAATLRQTERTVYAPELGFYVTPLMAADLAAMKAASAFWQAHGIAKDRQLLSVYTSALDIAAQSRSPAAVGSLIHALGPGNRADFEALARRREVAAVTTIAPDYSGWEGWLTRANAGFFAALHANYRPIGRNDQHVLWVRRDGGQPPRRGEAACRVEKLASHALQIEVRSPASGTAQIGLKRTGPFATGRSAVLTATEDSPFTRSQTSDPWLDFPRYGIPNTADIALEAPVEAGAPTKLLIEVVDGSQIGEAACEAALRQRVDFSALPGLPAAVAAHTGGRAP